jgi:cytochrome P450
VYASANRDPTRFDDPDDLDLERPQPSVHLGFGAGEHFCLGAHLARLEARVALERITDRFDEFALTGAGEEWDRSYFIHGISSLRVGFRPRVAVAP